MSKRTKPVIQSIWGIFKTASIWRLWLWRQKYQLVAYKGWFYKPLEDARRENTEKNVQLILDASPHSRAGSSGAGSHPAHADPGLWRAMEGETHIQHSSRRLNYPCLCFTDTLGDTGRCTSQKCCDLKDHKISRNPNWTQSHCGHRQSYKLWEIKSISSSLSTGFCRAMEVLLWAKHFLSYHHKVRT